MLLLSSGDLGATLVGIVCVGLLLFGTLALVILTKHG